MENIIIYLILITCVFYSILFLIACIIYTKAIIHINKQNFYEQKANKAAWDHRLSAMRQYCDLANKQYTKSEKLVRILNIINKCFFFARMNIIPHEKRKFISKSIKIGNEYHYPSDSGKLKQGILNEIIPCGSGIFMLMQDKNIPSRFNVTRCIFYK